MIIEPIPNSDKYRLCEKETLTYKGVKYELQKGISSDGASIPRFAWPLSTTPYNPTVIRAAFFHDDFYGKQYISRALADEIFHYILIEDGTEKQVAKNMYDTVRDFGKPAWDRYKRKLKKDKKK